MLRKDSELTYVLLRKKSIKMLQELPGEVMFTSSQFTKCPVLNDTPEECMNGRQELITVDYQKK